MASNASQISAGQGKRTSFSSFASNNASILLDRAKVGMRGSTPDSEALASSDDEHDQLYRLQTVTSNPGPKQVRRASWFTEGQQLPNRKPSFGAGTGPFSPVSPGTTASSSDQAPWNTATASTAGTTLGRGHSSSSSFTWGNTIWNSDGQKGPPQRLAEVLPSPTTIVPPGSASLYQDDNALRSPPLNREQGADPGIPFSIPLQPTLKSYRSQSYSVGQIDTDTSTNTSTPYGGQSNFNPPRRGASYAGVHHRPSRPSMLGDATHDLNALGQLREVDDDEEVSGGSSSGTHGFHDDARTFEDLAGENAMLRQQLAANQLQNVRSARPVSSAQRPHTSGQYYHQRLRDSVPEDLTSPLYDPNDREQSQANRPGVAGGRRFSEYSSRSSPHYALGINPDHKALDHGRRGQWQSSLGFARAEEPPKSRRHSFAEMPTRHNSLGSVNDDEAGRNIGDFSVPSHHHSEDLGAFGDGTSRPAQGDNSKFAFSYPPSKTEREMQLVARHSHDRDFAVNYFSQPNPSPRLPGDLQSISSTSLHQAYAQSQYHRSQPIGHATGRPNQLLYIVTFKCLRADVFYIQEGTGLRVKKGDLVIVEADRGTDLGTVQSEDISWAEAKQMKEDYTKRHHEWLMAFSHHTQNGTIAGPNPNGPSMGQTTAGLPNAAGFQDLPSGEIKPKMIKRLAQSHEIATLREKEGSEAKAKRMCHQKVVDHRLSMEILDAEFQMDWKKLTFFYFADSYINFNPLVTDLFKIYKTRIWMSAINTAAIATPHAGLRPPGLSRNPLGHEYDDFRSGQYAQPAVTSSPHGPLPAYNGMLISGMSYEQMYHPTLAGQAFEARQMSPFSMDYRHQAQQPMAHPSQFGPPIGYNGPNLHHTSSFTSQPDDNSAGHQNRQMRTEEWTQGFRNLSINQ
ncbi:uncharacterized protein KY384_004457 [Bacidia gigantensis]|uniref:uncharacterized protein n=1 Tax=Bacidia gigantensis TaxID=2732470 RepID=UPI001D050C69|nr:uncharacterized protein KY384_004457 [Bacidia gigantensis]KAG8531100.1 hypothetical protein KY384_004457 [Bacidia gigantensis]